MWEYEKLSRKLVDCWNQLHIILRCRQSTLIPRSLRLGSTVKGHRASQMLSKAQSQLGWIRQVYFTIDALWDKIHQTEAESTALLPASILEEMSSFVTKAQLAQHITSKKRQTSKFQPLLNRAYKTDTRPTYLGGGNKDPHLQKHRTTWLRTYHIGPSQFQTRSKSSCFLLNSPRSRWPGWLKTFTDGKFLQEVEDFGCLREVWNMIRLNISHNKT